MDMSGVEMPEPQVEVDLDDGRLYAIFDPNPNPTPKTVFAQHEPSATLSILPSLSIVPAQGYRQHTNGTLADNIRQTRLWDLDHCTLEASSKAHLGSSYHATLDQTTTVRPNTNQTPYLNRCPQPPSNVNTRIRMERPMAEAGWLGPAMVERTAQSPSNRPAAPPIPRLAIERMLSMSFDAMAQINARTGELQWANGHFDRLALCLGGGQPWEGQQTLFRCFLQNPSREQQLKEGTFKVGGVGTVLRCLTEVATIGANDVVLMVLKSLGNWPASPPRSSKGELEKSSNEVPKNSNEPPSSRSADGSDQDRSCSEPDNEPSQSEYPAAADHPDPMVKVVTTHVRGQGKRPAVLLWQRYGKKALYKPGGEAIKADRLERLYFRCHSPGCKARLRVDMNHTTGEQMKVAPTGVHDHVVVPQRAQPPSSPTPGSRS
eukprot:TRINITY_DN3249_c0_g3_i1.p1 TRINITY_DN3249_c0_g3~~TRINITY_DN3249_c0_g3_i1.p1  ORF type:complete len:432 (+),score=74.76 TRINITY_DN3249_c0_g3_i1:1118-2413(+)